MPNVHTLELEGEHFGNSICLTVVKVFPNLKRLQIVGCKITDLTPLEALHRLVGLNLFGSSVGDEQLQAIGNMSGLEDLCLHQTNVTEDGLKALFVLRNLVALDVRGLGIEKESAADLRANFQRRNLRISAGEYVAPPKDALEEVLQ